MRRASVVIDSSLYEHAPSTTYFVFRVVRKSAAARVVPGLVIDGFVATQVPVGIVGSFSTASRVARSFDGCAAATHQLARRMN